MRESLGMRLSPRHPRAVCDMAMSRRPGQITMVTHYTYTTLQIAWCVRCSLIPRPPLFLPPVRIMETSEKREHSLHEWMQVGCWGGGGNIKYVCSKLESEFVTSQDESF